MIDYNKIYKQNSVLEALVSLFCMDQIAYTMFAFSFVPFAHQVYTVIHMAVFISI